MKKTISRACLLLFVFATLSRLSTAQLTNTATGNHFGCPTTIPDNETTYSNWVYKDSSLVNHYFTGTDMSEWTETYIINPKLLPVTCGIYLKTSLDAYSTDGLYYLQATAGTGTVTAQEPVSGYVNLKYIVLGVTYAPPGTQSFVQYADSTTVGTSNALNGSFSSDVGLKVAVSSTISGGVTVPDVGGTFGWSDTTTDTFSTNFTDETDTSSSVAISSTDSWTTKVPGPLSAYVGVDHDYDVIWLWLNPLLNFTIYQNGTPHNITWTGYSYDADDVPEMDIYGVYLGWLTGRLSSPGPGTSDFAPLQRAWAGLASNEQVWPAGTSPSLVDPTDYAAIAAADPFSITSYTVTVPTTPAGNQTSSDGRFTLTGNQVVDYVQPGPGGQPYTQALTESTTKTQTQGEGAKYTTQLGYSWENKFTASFLAGSWSSDVTASDTLTFINQWSTTNTKATGVTATGSVTGPPCTVSGAVCSPVYTGPTEYEVFEDNVYGTFMFYPVN